MHVIIPLAGKGMRFYDKGFVEPKPMIKVFDKMILEYVIDNLRFDWAVDKFYIFYHYGLERSGFISHFTDKYPYIRFIRIEHHTRGAVETVLQGLMAIGDVDDESCLLIDCDTFYTTDILGMARRFSGNGLFCFQDDSTMPIFSYSELTEENRIVRVREKDKISNYANTGAYLFSSMTELKKNADYAVHNDIMTRNEMYTSCLIQHMIENGHSFHGIVLEKEETVFLGTPQQVSDYKDRTHAFLFDLDGTLVDTDSCYLKAWAKLLEPFSIRLTPEFYNIHIKGNNDKTVICNILPEHIGDVERISRMKDDYFISNMDDISIIEGSVRFMKEVRRRGHRICVVTNCNRIVAELILRYIGVEDIVEYLIIGNECERPKPYPDPYKKALDCLAMENTKSIIFEDSQSGYLSAKGVSPKLIVGVRLPSASLMIHSFSELDINELLMTTPNTDMYRLKRLIMDQFRDSMKIRSIDIDGTKLKGGFISDTIAATIITTSDKRVECVLKLQNEKSTTYMEKMARFLHLYEREYYLYHHLYSSINIRIPFFFGLLYNEKSERIGIMMENLNRPGLILNLDLNQQPVDVSLTVIDRIARLHGKFWGAPIIQYLDELRPDRKKFLYDRWDRFAHKSSCFVSDMNMRRFRGILERFDEIHDHLRQGPLTLCHGDIKSPNIFYQQMEKNRYDPIFLDWQYVHNGKGVQDLVFFIIESFSVANIRIYGPLFKEYYYIKLLENGVSTSSYSLEQYEKDFYEAACSFPFFVAVWFGSCDNEDLIDADFPSVFIQKLIVFLDIFAL
jgi:beta-phosphoglucomutase-like phosphatase (HAD superfamily)/choline kinase